MKKKKLETLRERDVGGCYSNGSQQTAQSDLANIIKTSFFSFFLGPIRPRAVGQGEAKGATGERVFASFPFSHCKEKNCFFCITIFASHFSFQHEKTVFFSKE
jgi:hypothetical protein